MNMGVAAGVLPVTGIPLPFVSFGGSSLVVTMMQIGVLMNISQYAHDDRRASSDARPAAAPAARAWGSS